MMFMYHAMNQKVQNNASQQYKDIRVLLCNEQYDAPPTHKPTHQSNTHFRVKKILIKRVWLYRKLLKIRKTKIRKL
jgi:hypothetical protein